MVLRKWLFRVKPAHVEQLLWLERESFVRALGGPK